MGGPSALFCLTRLRHDQSLGLPYFVTGMMLAHVVLSLTVFIPATRAGGREVEDAWRTHHSAYVVVDVAFVLWCLWCCVLRSPGRVPLGWEPPKEDGLEDLVLESSFCKKCDAFKPPRTHHCSMCRVCVSRYDHHCDWIDNCVGQDTHKLFWLFLVYATAACAHYFYLLWCYAYYSMRRHSGGGGLGVTAPPPSGDGTFSVTALFALSLFSVVVFALLLFSATFLWYTTGNLLRNQTSMEADYVMGEPYDRGVLTNLRHVLGPNPALWLLPVAAPPPPMLANVTAKQEATAGRPDPLNWV